MSTYWEEVHEEEKDGFTIKLSVTPEDMEPDWDFETEEDRQQILDDINSGRLAWFIAKVQAFKNGVPLGVDYLGGCCYDSVKDFVKENDYYGDMVDSVISQSKGIIQKLAA